MARHYATFLSLLVWFGWAPLAQAYPTPVDFTGKLLRWNVDVESGPILYEIVTATPGDRTFFAPAIEEAVSMWNGVEDSYFRYAEASSEETAQVTIELQPSTGDEFSSGYAIFDQTDDNGPVHCQILIGTQATYEGFAKTVLHELGHCLGLGHSLIPQAIMSYKLDQNGFGLDVDDKAALVRLYPANGESPKLPLGCSIGMRHKGITPFLLLAPIFIVGLRHRRRRDLGSKGGGNFRPL